MGPGAILIVSHVIFVKDTQLNCLCHEEWLRRKSGIDKKYFEGEPYKALRSRVKSSCQYARTDVKDVVRVFSSH